MKNKLYVAGLPYDVTEDELRRAFAAVGTVVSVRIIADKQTNQSKGFGFVEMSTEEDAKTAVQQLNNSQQKGRSIVVELARPQI